MKNEITALTDYLAGYLIRSGTAEQVDELGLVLYSDHLDPGWFGVDKYKVNQTNAIEFSGVTNNLEEYIFWLKKTLNAFNDVLFYGGGDAPEAMNCAVVAARNLFPGEQNTIWVVTDSPPHNAPWLVCENHSQYNCSNCKKDKEAFDCKHCQNPPDLTGVNVLLSSSMNLGWPVMKPINWKWYNVNNILIVADLAEVLQQEGNIFEKNEPSYTSPSRERYFVRS